MNVTESNLRTNSYKKQYESTLHKKVGKLRAVEDMETIVEKNKIYDVYLVKDDKFPEGEEAIIGEDGELATLLCFKHERVD